jgi:hypothetical protein
METIILADRDAPSWRRKAIMALAVATGRRVLLWDVVLGRAASTWANGEAPPKKERLCWGRRKMASATFEGHVPPSTRAQLRAEGLAVADPPGLGIEDEARYRALQAWYREKTGLAPESSGLAA